MGLAPPSIVLQVLYGMRFESEQSVCSLDLSNMGYCGINAGTIAMVRESRPLVDRSTAA